MGARGPEACSSGPPRPPVAALLEIASPEHSHRRRQGGRSSPRTPFTARPDLMLGWNAYSGSGDVTAEVVYANYGTKDDFESSPSSASTAPARSSSRATAGTSAATRPSSPRPPAPPASSSTPIPPTPATARASRTPRAARPTTPASSAARSSRSTTPAIRSPPAVEATEDAKRLDSSDGRSAEDPRAAHRLGRGAADHARMTGAGGPAGLAGRAAVRLPPHRRRRLQGPPQGQAGAADHPKTANVIAHAARRQPPRPDGHHRLPPRRLGLRRGRSHSPARSC